MPSDPSTFSHIPASRLAQLLDLEPRSTRWSAADGDAALLHQLRAPLLPDLLLTPATDAGQLTALAAGKTFAGALNASTTPLVVLEAIKNFARMAREEVDSPLSGAPATVLYYAAIAAALRQGQRITSLSDAQLQEGLSWCRAQAAAADLHPLFPSMP